MDESTLNSLKKFNACEILNYVKQDKKVLAGSITLVILENIGQVKFIPIKLDEQLIDKIQKAMQSLF
jgi:3-dehydroquinate synthetase